MVALFAEASANRLPVIRVTIDNNVAIASFPNTHFSIQQVQNVGMLQFVKANKQNRRGAFCSGTSASSLIGMYLKFMEN